MLKRKPRSAAHCSKYSATIFYPLRYALVYLCVLPSRSQFGNQSLMLNPDFFLDGLLTLDCESCAEESVIIRFELICFYCRSWGTHWRCSLSLFPSPSCLSPPPPSLSLLPSHCLFFWRCNRPQSPEASLVLRETATLHRADIKIV